MAGKEKKGKAVGKTAKEKDAGKAKAAAKEKAVGGRETREKKTGAKEKTRVGTLIEQRSIVPFFGKSQKMGSQTGRILRTRFGQCPNGPIRTSGSNREAQNSGPGEKVRHSGEAKEKVGHAKSEKVHRKEKRAKGDAEKRLAKIKVMIKKKFRPHFKGMFGNRQMRNVSDAKWDRWRHPSGIDVRRLREHGLWPSTGYRTPKAIRYLHPSGTTVTLVHNTKELDAVGRGIAARIASKVGGKKRVQIIALAKQKGIRVLNA